MDNLANWERFVIKLQTLANIVDDFFWCGETIFEQLVMNKFTAHFSIGSTCASKFKYLGLNIVFVVRSYLL